MQPPSPQSPDDWNQHWGTYAEVVTQNPAQAYRRQLIFERLELEHAARPRRVLELGSGQGDLSREILERVPDAELLGLDISETGVEIARKKAPRGRFFQQDFTKPLAIPEEFHGWATHAICSEVLEHVEQPLVVLRNVRRLLAPGARLVVTVPGGPVSAFDRYIGHRGHFTADLLGRLLDEAGFELGALHGAGFPFFNLYRLLVVARGEKLIDEAAGTGPLPPSAQAAVRAFSWLFKWNKAETRHGWQLVATAFEPPSSAASAGYSSRAS
jgi:SAM-dependent methyltransferase